MGSTVRARRWFAQDVTVDPRLAAVALTMGHGALTAMRPRQKQTRPAAAWHHLGVAVVSFAWHGSQACPGFHQWPSTYYPLRCLTDAASQAAHSPTTCVLPQAVHIGAAAAEEEKLHVLVPEVDDLNTTCTSDPTIMATPGPEVSPRQ
jgi:hypothetical protein